MKRITALLAVATALAFAGAAAADPSPTPNGYTGAWNMLQDPTMLPGSGGAMDKANVNGNIGMCRAASVSSGVGC